MKFSPLSVLIAILLPILLSGLANAQPVRRPNIEVEFVSSVSEIIPGTPFWVGIRFSPDPKWHVYWKYAGDSGIAPKLTWHLPRAFSAGEIQWPKPERLPLAHLVNFGYASEVILPILITPAPDLKDGVPVGFGVSAEWLVCEEECIPGDAQFTMELPVHSTATTPSYTSWHERIEGMRRRVPHTMDVVQELGMRADINGSNYELSWEIPADVKLSPYEAFFFPSRPRQIENAAPQKLVVDPRSRLATLTLKRTKVSERPVSELKGVLTTPQGWGRHIPNDAVEFSLRVEGVPMVAETPQSMISAAAEPVVVPQQHYASFFLAIGLAFLGGLLLNLMPCVFPVLSIKILGLVKQADKDPRAVRMHGALFGAGVLVSFWVLAGALLIVRAGGGEIGWGFQLQSPGFVVVLCFTIFILGLNLMGLFEFGGRIQSIAGQVGVSEGYFGSFMSGVLATVLATPCTAPFMGTALAAALTMPPAQSLLVFTALGGGMALPFGSIASFPRLVRFVPKPGAWMETFKHIVAFPLFATVIWLLWVLSLQLGPNSTIGLLSALLLVFIGFWVHGRFGNLAQSRRRRRSATIVTAALLLGAAYLAWPRGVPPPHASGDGMVVHDSYGLEWQVYSPKGLNDLLQQGKSVYLDFTAAWCISCQVNKSLVFGSREVRDLIAEKEVVLVRADWTSRDATIAEALRSFGRDGVPLNVLYKNGDTRNPILLPALLTAGIVVNELRAIP